MKQSKKIQHETIKSNVEYLWLGFAAAFLTGAGSLFGNFDPAFVLVLAVLIIGLFFVSYSLPTKRENRATLLTAGGAVSAINLLIIIDVWSESTSMSNSCGVGFGAGNCFLLDGLSVIMYIPLFFILLTTSTILLSVNMTQKTKKLNKGSK